MTEDTSPVLTEIPRYIPPPPTYRQEVTPAAPRRPTANILLFALTLLTTTMAGAYMAGVDHPLLRPAGLVQGLTFSVPLMAILLFHELGHYITARRNNVSVTPPYFIPAPLPSVFIIGTFGAFIKMKSLPRTRRVMFDVGAAGPWAGMILALPAVIIGLHYSVKLPLDRGAGGYELGNSLLFFGLTRWILGVNPNDFTIILHPTAIAGWVGLFVTTMNLLPVGQLDGGHVIYALFGRSHRAISRLFVVCCVLMVVVPWMLGWSYWLGWLLWAVLLVFLGLGHPAAMDSDMPLDPRRRAAAWLTIALFVATFTPVPLSLAPPAEPPNGQVYDVVHHPAQRHPHWLSL
jgi:membrane-associated protease RseP (regulator of RpoE activity)